MVKDKKVILVFPQEIERLEQERKESMIKLGKVKEISELSMTLGDIKENFLDFGVKEIELWISGGISTEGITKLFISAKGEGGMRVTLIPKT